MRKLIVLGMVLVLASTGFAASLQQGTQEVVVEGLFDPDGLAGDQTDLALKYGKFIQDNVEVGALAGYSDNDFFTTYEVGAFAEFNFDLGSELVPFLGAGGSWVSLEAEETDADADGFSVYAEGGMKYFLADNVAISASVKYQKASDDVFIEDDEATDDNVTLNLAMRFYLPAGGP